MIDIKFLRSDPEKVTERLVCRSPELAGEVCRLLSADSEWRELVGNIEALKAEQNAASRKIPELRKTGGDVGELTLRLRNLSDRIKAGERSLSAKADEVQSILLSLPNLPDPSVPPGKDSEDNPEVRRWGEIRDFGFEQKPHWELGEALGILDAVAAAKVTGSRFDFYKGAGARLERSVINFFMDTHAGRGYTEILPPYLVNRAAMTGTGQLPKFEEDAFKVADTDYFLIPTAEVPVTNYHRDEILEESDLPLWYCAYSACFRAEAGSAGRDTRGLIRRHQFNKVELVKLCVPERSCEELESLTADAEILLQRLELPYRVVCLCAGDLGFANAKTYDLEVYMPSYGRYLEISSCSNYGDYQARRASIRVRGSDGRVRPLHTLNGSGLAVGRTVAAILETYQRSDGRVDVPSVLRPYMGGVEVI